MHRPGPYRTTVANAQANIFPKAAIVGSYTFDNQSVAAATVTLYDDPVSGSNTNPIEVVQVPANSTKSLQIETNTLNGLSIDASSWTTLKAYVRWSPR